MPTDLEESKSQPDTDSDFQRDRQAHEHGHGDEAQDAHGSEGGPVKSFLEHLEDLRWVLIKSLAAVGIGMLICLIAGNQVMAILTRPLDQATFSVPSKSQLVSVKLGTNRVGRYVLPLEQAVPYQPLIGSNTFVELQLQLVPSGSNFTVMLSPVANPNIDELKRLGTQLGNFGPVGGFVVALQVALYGGFVLAAPFVFYFIAAFIFPALKMNEKYYVYRGLGFGLVLFMIGVSFCYFVLLPLALTASAGYSNWLGLQATQWRAEEYISFVCKFMLGMGVGFQMPVVLLTLVKIGVLNYTILSKMRRYMIVINLVLGALLTTPEVLTQVMMAIPLQMLYEITVWIAWYWERRDRKRAAAGQ